MCKATFLLLNMLIRFYYQIHIVEGIIGGYNARPGQFKYAVAVQAYIYDTPIPEKRNLCSGVLVTDEDVVTAAHCVIDSANKFMNLEWFVVVGVVNPKEKDSIEMNVTKIIVPLIYNSKQVEPKSKVSIYSDLAVFKLDKKLDLASNIRRLIAADLPPLFSTDVTHVEETAIITGFGLTVPSTAMLNKFNESTPLHFAETVIIPNSWCQLMSSEPIRRDHICGQLKTGPHNTKMGVTKGDGGAPLVINGNLLIGILSYSKKHESGNYKVEVYINVAYYLPFIYAAMQGQKLPDNRVAIYEYKNTRKGWRKSIKEI